MATVSLDSAALRYVTESGELLERDNKTKVTALTPGVWACGSLVDEIRELDDEIDGLQEELIGAGTGAKGALVGQIKALVTQRTQKEQELQNCATENPQPSPSASPVRVGIVRGVMASASVAGINNYPVVLARESYTDGGFREGIPVQAAVDLGADTIYAIGLSPRDLDRAGPYESKHLLDFLGRGLAGIALNEVEVNDTDPPGGWEGRTVNLIRPTVEIHNSLTIDPGLIAISMAYGYMRAADVVRGVDQGSETWSLATDISVLRKEIWRLECLVHGQPVPGIEPMHPPDFTLLDLVRTKKHELQTLIERRRQLGGLVPSDTARWWANADRWPLDWERHPWTPVTLGWHRNDLTDASGGAPAAAGDPAGYVLGDGQHVVYRTNDGRIQELWFRLE